MLLTLRLSRLHLRRGEIECIIISEISPERGERINDSKFSAHSFLLVFTIVAAIFFFFAVKVVDLADRYTANDYYPIEGTDDLAIRYSTQKTSGIYRGDKNTSTLMLEGLYGFDWGCVADGDWLPPGEGKGYPLQCSGLENSMDCGVHGVAKSQT